MHKARKLTSLLLALVLVIAMMALAGCGGGTADEGTADEPVAQGIQSVDDLNEGDRIGVQSGTTGEEWAQQELAPRGVIVVPYEDILAAFGALQAGDVVGVINDLPISQDVVKDEARGLEVVEEIPTGEQYGFAFNQNSTDLRDAVNWGLAEIIADGTYDTVYERWFGAAPESMPEATSGATEPSGDFSTLQPGKIVIGSDTAYPPFEFIEGGVAQGFDVDLMNAIGEKLGKEIEFKTYKFDALITGLQSGSEFDMVASAMTITEERAKAISFSDPYINSNQSLAVRKAQ